MTTDLQERPAPVAAAPSTAQNDHPNATATLPKEFLSFRLAGEEYGIDILRVQEIRSYEPPTRIANAPEFIKGVVNLRGVIVPVIDLRIKLGCTAQYDEFTVVIVLSVLGRVVGAVVDAVSDVLALGATDVLPAPTMNAAVDASHILGIACVKAGDVDRMLILTDIERMMSDTSLLT